MKKQRGLGMLGNMFVVFMLIVGALLAFKLFPAYSEYFAIKRIFKSVAASPGLKDARELKRAFERYATIDNVTAIKPEDIEISNGAVIANYRVIVPLVANASLLLEFNPSSDH
jgi:hypothetical protein